MVDIGYKSGKFPSSDGKSQVFYYIFDNVKEPKGIIQISHGMQEHILRYDIFARYFNSKGFIVVGNDDLGHGKTAKAKEEEGYFGKRNGEKYIVKDLHKMTEIAKEKFPNLPIFLFGHSMGSFFARYYASEYKDFVNGYIFCGTSGNFKMQKFGLFMMKLIRLFVGGKSRSNIAEKNMVKGYFKYIPKEEIKNGYEWVTSNSKRFEQVCNENDKKIFFTLSAFIDMVKLIIRVNKKSWAKKLDKNTPILLTSGAQDPVGQYGVGVCNVYKLLENQMVNSIDLRLYGKGRHEIQHEIPEIRDLFYDDLTTWINSQIKNKKILP